MAINEVIRKVSDVVSNEISYDAESQNIKVSDNAFNKALDVINENDGSSLTKKDVQKVFDAVTLYTAATGLATGELAINEMAKEQASGVNSMLAKFNIAKQVDVTHTISREHDATPIKRDENQDVEKVIKYGRLDSKLEMRSIKARSNSSIAAVRDHLYQLGEEKLK